MIKAQFDENSTQIWFPGALRTLYEDPNELMSYYFDMDIVDIYSFTLVSVFMLMVGSDMGPVNQLQVIRYNSQ